MKRLLLSILFVAFVFVAPTMAQIMFPRPQIEDHGDTLVIKKDLGGPMVYYMSRYAAMEQRHIKLGIDGECDSSCTLFFGYLPEEAICVTPNAKLGFHRASTPEGTTVMLSKYPDPILMWLLDAPMTEDIKYLPQEIIEALFKPCAPYMKPQGESIEPDTKAND